MTQTAKHYFGKDISVRYTYPAGLSPVSPEIFIFRDMPSRESARDGTGALLAAVTSWTQASDEKNTKLFTIPAFSDPDIDTTQAGREYFLGINYELASGEETQTDIKRIYIYRVGGSVTNHGVDVSAVMAAYPTLASYLSEDEIDDQISLAIDELSADLLPGVNWDKVTNKSDFYFPILCKAIANSCLSEFEEQGDRWFTRYEIFEKKYKDFIGAHAVKSDEDVSGDTDKSNTIEQDFVLRYR